MRRPARIIRRRWPRRYQVKLGSQRALQTGNRICREFGRTQLLRRSNGLLSWQERQPSPIRKRQKLKGAPARALRTLRPKPVTQGATTKSGQMVERRGCPPDKRRWWWIHRMEEFQ